VARLCGFDDRGLFAEAIAKTGLESRSIGRNLREHAAMDPTNWGAWSRASLMAVAWESGDPALIAEAWDALRRYLENGPNFTYKSDQVSWGRFTIAPKGYAKDGVDLDGAVHDIYRGGDFPRVGADGLNYVWEATQGTITAAIFADLAGHPEVWTVGDAAICRAVDWMYRFLDEPASGDDRYLLWITNDHCADHPTETPTTAGKGFGFSDWWSR
jgi:hypothetical protein